MHATTDQSGAVLTLSIKSEVIWKFAFESEQLCEGWARRIRDKQSELIQARVHTRQAVWQRQHHFGPFLTVLSALIPRHTLWAVLYLVPIRIGC